MKNKLISSIFIMVLCILINTIVNAKYVIENQFEIAKLNIDRTKPVIELIDITNTNVGYENYANKEDTITLKLKIIEKNISKIYFDEEHVKIKLDNNYIVEYSINAEKIEDVKDGEIYKLHLSNINGNGKLKIDLLEGTILDKGSLVNNFQEIDTQIIIDNVVPEWSFSENKISDGKVTGSVKTNEPIRNIEGWNFSQDNLKLEKEFTNNISYELPIIDYAGNKANVNVLSASGINSIFSLFTVIDFIL